MAITERQIELLLMSRPQSLEELTARITPDLHAELKTAVELRRWQDGKRLTEEQLENCLQLVILYETHQLPEEQRTGFALPFGCQSRETAIPAPVVALRVRDDN
jgi:uncharacterized protein YeaC (DUF1315 family)